MHYLWSNEASSLKPTLQTMQIQASHLNMWTQDVKTHMHMRRLHKKKHLQL